MASKSETGHARNVAKFESLISFCTSYGTPYNPFKSELEIQELNTLLSSAHESINRVTNAKNILDLVINERQIKFSSLRPMATRIISALTVSYASPETVADAKSINKKIQGRRATPIPEKINGNEIKTISTSQQSYDNLLANFVVLTDLVGSVATYTPNETELQLTSLQTYIQELRAANTAVIDANTIYRNAIIARNNTLYAPNTGMLDIASDVKTYVKSIFGSSSPQYKQIRKINFRKP